MEGDDGDGGDNDGAGGNGEDGGGGGDEVAVMDLIFGLMQKWSPSN